ncbi:MAG: hypothetical protein ACI93R_001124 [Flavobacteriales bacterium]|jgi:hypothetical protein
MEKIDLIGLGNALGIYDPWAIKSFKADDENKTFDIHLEIKDQKRLFGLFGSHKKSGDTGLLKGHWVYMPIAGYRCIIHAEVPEQSINMDAPLSLSLINQSCFLGHPSRPYSNYVRQQLALAQIKGIDTKTISDFFQLGENVPSAVLTDLNNTTAQIQSLAFLPTEVDPVWERILLDKQLLKTAVLPLKLLLSKQKIQASKIGTSIGIKPLIIELRKFFIANAHLMDNEIEQLCGITSQKLQQRARANKSKQRLVLPSIKNPLWLDLLSGKLNLNSQSVPLNLLISRQRMAFIQGHNTQEKIQAIETLRDYVRKNYRNLKPELVLLNRAMNIRQKSTVQLPNPDHRVWQHILENDNLVPSENIAYKLLLANLRTRIASKGDPVVKIQAARRIRDFIQQNQKTMRTELGALLQQSKTA